MVDTELSLNGRDRISPLLNATRPGNPAQRPQRNHLLTHETLFALPRYCSETFGAQDAINDKGRQMTLAFALVVLSVAIFIGLDLILEGYLRRGRLQR